MCGKKIKNRPCDNPQWNCDEICDRLLPCQQHKCQIVRDIIIVLCNVVWFRCAIQEIVETAPKVARDFVHVGKKVENQDP